MKPPPLAPTETPPLHTNLRDRLCKTGARENNLLEHKITAVAEGIEAEKYSSVDLILGRQTKANKQLGNVAAAVNEVQQRDRTWAGPAV